jgi:periplasmic protein TonB
MKNRKNPEADLRRYSGLFFQIGLLCALLLTVSAFEWRTVDVDPIVEISCDFGSDIDTILPTFHDEKIKPPKPKKVIPVNVIETPDEIEVEPLVEWGDTDDILIEDIPAPEPEVADIVRDYVEHMPEPKGGMQAFMEYVARNVKYTRQARSLDIEGKVFVQFVVDTEGSITEAKVLRGVGAGLDEEALRVIKNAPPWNPGRQGGRKVKVRMVIPISFQLN